MIDLPHRNKLMIAQLKESHPFATGVKLQVEHVLVERLGFLQIVNLDRNMVAAVDLNAHGSNLSRNFPYRTTLFVRYFKGAG